MSEGDRTGVPSVDDLLDRAVAALNRGDVAGAHALADEVLAVDAGNLEAGEVRAAAGAPSGELRRLTLVFCDLVGSTQLSEQLEPEAYHGILQTYQDLCTDVVEAQHGGAIISFHGDGILAAFGYPLAHEDDADRAVLAGLGLLQGVEGLARAVRATAPAGLSVRVAVHRGAVFLDRKRGDLYGLAANVAARLEGLADPGTMLVSDEVRALLGDRFDLLAHPPREVKGVSAPIVSHTVLGERSRLDDDRPQVPLIGREGEVATLQAAWQLAAAGQRAKGTCVAITGEPGIGKSRLVAAVRDAVRSRGGVVVDLAGSLRFSESGLYPFRRLLEDDAGIERLDDGPRRLARLTALAAESGTDPRSVPLLATLLGLDPATGYAAPELDARQLRESIEAALLDYVTTRTSGRPALIVVEDLHWIDAATRDLVLQLVRLDAPHRLVVVSSRRPADAPRGDSTTRIELAPLDDLDRLALVHAIVGDRIDELALRDVAEQSDGVPLYAEELARAATAGAGVTAAGPGSSALPDVLYGSLVARLNVSPQVMEVAATAAVIGRQFDPGLLARACPLTIPEQTEGLRVLRDERILESAPDQSGQLRFRHDLLRAVVDDLQPPSHRRDLHRAVAGALVADDVDPDALDWLIVATHLEAAEETERAAAAFGRASASARQRGDLLEARLLLTRAVELIEGSAGVVPELEIDLRLRRGFLAVSLEGNSSASAVSDYERCLELALETTHAGALLSTLGCLGSYFAARAEFDRSREILGGLVRVHGPLQPFGEFFAMAGHALCDIYCGDTRAGLLRAEQALRMQAEFGSPAAYSSWWFTPLDPSVLTHTMVAIGHFSVGDVAGTDERLRIAREASEVLPFPNGAFSLAGHLSLEVWLAAELGDDEKVDDGLQRIAEISARHGFDQWAIVAATAGQAVEGLKAVRAGDADAASRCAATLGGHLMMWKLVDQWVFLTYYLTIQGVLHAAAGERDLARAAYEEAMELSARTGMGFYEVETRRHLAALVDDLDEREVVLRDALGLAREQGNAIFELRTALDLERLTGDLEPARAALSRISPEAHIAVVAEARALVAEGGRS